MKINFLGLEIEKTFTLKTDTIRCDENFLSRELKGFKGQGEDYFGLDLLIRTVAVDRICICVSVDAADTSERPVYVTSWYSCGAGGNCSYCTKLKVFVNPITNKDSVEHEACALEREATFY